MKTFKIYLEENGYSDTTVESYVYELQGFIKWCNRNHTTPHEIDYQTCLKFIQYLNRRKITKRSVNHKLGVVKKYFNYLISESCRADNPIENTVVKGAKKHINYNTLEAEELEDLYYSFDTENYQEHYHQYTAKRNKVIVGLLVYQGLNTTELINLTLEDLQLYQGKIYVKGSKRSNARTLELKSWQVIEFLEYTKEVREEIKRKWRMESERIFVPNNKRLGNTVQRIIKELKKTNHKVENSNQIRASVITNWLKQYNLRKVQYLAGHRYISSTERYLQDDLENLHEIVNNFHPIS